MPSSSGTARRLEWGAAFRPLAGQAVSGDRYAVVVAAARALVAVVDGLGHGAEAAVAAETVTGALEGGADSGLTALFGAAHAAARKTRGVTLTAAVIDTEADTLAWAGVGDVEGVIVRAAPGASPAREHLLRRSGVVGWQLPAVHVATLVLRPADTLLLATDGLQPGFELEHEFRDAPRVNAERMLDRCARETDDALVVVVRYLEPRG